MNPLRKKLSLVGAIAVLICTSLVGIKSDGGVPFLVASGISILVLCALFEALLPYNQTDTLRRRLGAGASRGSLLGAGVWIVLMILISVFIETGDKFPLYVVAFIPAAVLVGAIAGFVAALVGYQTRRLA
jgi:hypothetical protein